MALACDSKCEAGFPADCHKAVHQAKHLTAKWKVCDDLSCSEGSVTQCSISMQLDTAISVLLLLRFHELIGADHLNTTKCALLSENGSHYARLETRIKESVAHASMKAAPKRRPIIGSNAW